MKNKDREKINELLTYLKKSNDYRDRYEIIDYIKNNDKLPFDDDTFYDVVKIIIDNNMKFADSLQIAIELNEIIDEYTIFLKVLPTFLKQNLNLNNSDNKSYYLTIYNLFQNKKLFLQISDKIVNESYFKGDKLKKICEFMITIRKYYVDEIAFFSSVIEVMNNYIVSDSFMEDKIEEAKKIAGFYDIDEEYLRDFVKKTAKIEDNYSDLYTKSSKLSEKIASTILSLNDKYNSLKEKENRLNNLNNRLNNMDKKIDEVLKNENILITQEDIDDEVNKIFNEIKQYFITNYQLEDKEDENDLYIIKLIKREMRINKTLTISDEKLQEFKYKYFALKNNSCELLDELYDKCGDHFSNKLINLYEENQIYDFLSHKCEGIFDTETYINIIRKMDLYQNFILINDPLFLKEILKKNPNFNIRYYYLFHINQFELDLQRLQEIKRVFGVDWVANAKSKLFEIMFNHDIDGFEYFKRVLEINSDFPTKVVEIPLSNGFHQYCSTYKLMYPNDIISPERTANLSDASINYLLLTCRKGRVLININEMTQLTEEEKKYINDFIDEVDRIIKQGYDIDYFDYNILEIMNTGISAKEYFNLEINDIKKLFKK